VSVPRVVKFSRFDRRYRLTHTCSGAVKSNIGHLEGASGLASVIKTLLVLEKGVIPPNSNFEHINPKIDEHAFNIKVHR